MSDCTILLVEVIKRHNVISCKSGIYPMHLIKFYRISVYNVLTTRALLERCISLPLLNFARGTSPMSRLSVGRGKEGSFFYPLFHLYLYGANAMNYVPYYRVSTAARVKVA